MNRIRTTVAVVSAGAVIAAPLGLGLASGAAHADGPQKVERFGIAGADAEFSVEKEDNGSFEVSAEVDRAKPGSKWTIVLRHEGKVFSKKTLTADSEGDVDVDRHRANTAGADTFKVKIKHGDTAKKRTIKMR